MSDQKTVNKQTLLWIGVAIVSALVAAATVAVVLRRYFKKEELCGDTECISYDFEPEELEFDDEFGADNVIDVTEFIDQAEE